MTSTLFQPLDRTLRKMFNDATNYQRQVGQMVKNIGSSQANREQFEHDLLRLNQSAQAMIEDNVALGFNAREVEDAHLADKMADVIMQVERLDYVQAVDYIALARHLENTDESLYEAAIVELLSYEGGEDRVRALLAAIGKILRSE